MTEQELKAFLAQKALETWELRTQPYLLSVVSNDLKEKGESYKEALGEEKLKTFVLRVAASDNLFAVVEHPRQRAKVGLIPTGESFSFPLEERKDERKPSRSARIDRDGHDAVVIGFLRALKSLPDDILDEVVIPAKAIAYLLGKR